MAIKKVKKKYEEVIPKSDAWKPVDVEDFIEGEVVEIAKGQYGWEYTLKLDNDELVKTPNHTVLNKRMELTQVGDCVKVVYKGEKDTGKGNPLQLYKLLRVVVEEESVE